MALQAIFTKMMRDDENQLDRVKSGKLTPLESPAEAHWYANWSSAGCGDHEPLAMALMGGAIADRLAWVFHAGYQGMMRYAFPFCPQDGWASYLVADDRSGEYPDATVKRSGSALMLSGYKSWVAASRHVRYLVVRVHGPDEDMIVLVESDDEGVQLSHRDRPGFLSELSQGFAAFEDVPVTDTRVLRLADLPENFSRSEPLHVLTALNAFMLSHTLALGGNEHIESAATASLRNSIDLASHIAVADDFLPRVAKLDAQTSETAALFESFVESRNKEFVARFRKDRGLVKMFSKGLQASGL